MKDIDKSKALESLENDIWKETVFPSNLIEKCHILRKKPINTLTVEDLRLLINQNIGLNYLIPIAIIILKKDLFTEGDFYEGDLLQSVLNIDSLFWLNNSTLFDKVDNLIFEKLIELKEMNIKFEKFYSRL